MSQATKEKERRSPMDQSYEKNQVKIDFLLLKVDEMKNSMKTCIKSLHELSSSVEVVEKVT